MLASTSLIVLILLLLITIIMLLLLVLLRVFQLSPPSPFQFCAARAARARRQRRPAPRVRVGRCPGGWRRALPRSPEVLRSKTQTKGEPHDWYLSIPLNKLVDSAENVRKTAGADGALQELAASIAAHGLLQSLVVRRAKKGKFAVVAGGRRLRKKKQIARGARSQR
jgi:hypothetical protein